MISAKIKTRIYYNVIAIILLLITALLFSLFTMNQLQNNLKTQVHTRTVILTLKDNLTFLMDAEKAEHDLENKDDTNYVQKYMLARQNITTNTKQLHTFINDNPSQQQNLDTLDKFINLKLSFIDKLMSIKKQGNEQTIKATLLSRESKYLMDNIRKINRAMQESEAKLFTEKQLATAKSVKHATNIFIVEFILLLLITVFLMFTVLAEFARRTKAKEQINKTNVALENINRDLESKINFIQDNEKRIVDIMDALIKTTQLDFSDKLTISDKGDEIDAIAVGLNTMSEELEFHLQQLKRSEEKLNDAQRLAKIGNWEMDMATKKVQWSNEMFNVYGYGDERFEVSFEKTMERMLPEDIELTKALMEENIEEAKQLFKEKNVLEFETPPSTYTIILPDDSRKVVKGIGKVILNTQGQVTNIVGTVQDIDEQHKAEKKLNQYITELERKNREIQQFAYAASHDLQEPLRSISNFSSLLAKKLEKYPDEEINKYMSLVSGGANRMSNLIFDLLEYSRIGKDMSKSVTDCNELVHEILVDLSAIIEESGASFHIKKLPVVNCHDLKSVLQNLIINAIKFKKKYVPPVIDISASDTGKEFLFAIKDNGIGIEKDYYERIFIIFQRLHLRTEYAGTGIGLSLTRKINEMHNGKIWVESEFGEGSTFYFTIPKN